MSGTIHALKACALFCLALLIKVHILHDFNVFVSMAYYIITMTICYNYGSNYRLEKLPPNNMTVTIIGAGFSGIGMAVKLKELGVKFRILEADEKLGGTWWQNQYPGCACDTPSHLYSFSFCLNPNWSRSFSGQAEILKYLEMVADKYGITKYIEFGKKVKRTTWDDDEKKWMIELANGETVTTNIIVNGVGLLGAPKTPEFLGDDLFNSVKIHSAQWPSGYNLAGKNVAIIGTGATAVQIVPSIAKKVKSLTVFQRTAAWVPPKFDFATPSWLKILFSIFPPALFGLRCFWFFLYEFWWWNVMRTNGLLRNKIVNLTEWNYLRVVKNQDVCKKLIPGYGFLCKRMTPSDEYLQAFNDDHVTLETDSIKCFTKDGMQTSEGKNYNFDTIIYATGYDPVKTVQAYEILGRKDNSNKNISFAEYYKDEPRAYKGVTTPNFPNFFWLLGPGTVLGHSSVVYMIECEITYVTEAIKTMVKNDIKIVDIREEVEAKYNRWMHEDLKNKAFNLPSCTSWYRNAAGVNWTFWPGDLITYWWVTRKFDLESYHC